VQCAGVIVTFNGRHFPADALEPWLVEARHPDEFLVDQYRRYPEVVDQVLREQARAIKSELGALLAAQRKGLPRFVEAVGARLALD